LAMGSGIGGDDPDCSPRRVGVQSAREGLTKWHNRHDVQKARHMCCVVK
jgi:hypothetical protein